MLSYTTSLSVPDRLVRALVGSERILLVTHVPLDGDTLGSALGLARALRATGKEAWVCADDLVPGRLRKLAMPAELLRAEALPSDLYFDTVILVDVGERQRIGGAAHRLAEARRVLVLDHHQIHPNAASLGICPSTTELLAWVDPNQDATAILVWHLIIELFRKLGVPSACQLQHASFPLLAAIYTDTGGFTQPGVGRESRRIFDDLLEAHHEANIQPLERALAYRLPYPALERLNSRFVRGPVLSRRYLARQFVQPQVLQGLDPVPYLACPRSTFETALETARACDPETNTSDVRNVFMERLDALVQRHPVALLFIEQKHQVHVSIRSRDEGPALRLARRLGGNGHARKAAARPAGTLSHVLRGALTMAVEETLWVADDSPSINLAGLSAAA